MGTEEECGVRGDGGIREKVERGKRTEERRRKRTEREEEELMRRL